MVARADAARERRLHAEQLAEVGARLAAAEGTCYIGVYRALQGIGSKQAWRPRGHTP